jgi:cold shock CspA family protein
MSRSQESFNKKEVRNKKEKKRKEKEKKRQERKEQGKKSNLDDMIAYVDENGNITDTPPDPDQKTEIDPKDIEISPAGRKDEEPDPIRKGTIAFYNEQKGFGFINDSITKERVFFHVNNTEEEVKEGNLVSYEVEQGPRGLSATHVKQLK